MSSSATTTPLRLWPPQHCVGPAHRTQPDPAPAFGQGQLHRQTKKGGLVSRLLDPDPCRHPGLRQPSSPGGISSPFKRLPCLEKDAFWTRKNRITVTAHEV